MRVAPSNEQCSPVEVKPLQPDSSFAGALRAAFSRRFRPPDQTARDVRLELWPGRAGLIGHEVGRAEEDEAGELARSTQEEVEHDLEKRLAMAPRGVAARYLVTLRASCVREFPGERPSASTRTGADAYFEFQVEKTALAAPGNPQPTYPPMLKSAGVTGRVLVQFVVDSSGTPDMSTFKVLETSHELFSAAVRDAVARWRYSPAEIAGAKVAQVVQQPFTFAGP